LRSSCIITQIIIQVPGCLSILFSLPSIVRWRSSKYLQRCVIWSSLKASQQGHG
jgi:hypothetical protein